jgi:sporulation protein YlmC with PRC-barrel domain
MLQNTKELYRDKISAIDGDIGQVKDFYFDDKTWMVRYLVVDTGSWLTGRLVLLSPHALGKLNQFEKTLQVKLDKKQIENSPAIASHLPVSRQHEAEYYRYYGWPAYWDTEAAWGLGGFPQIVPASNAPSCRRADKHLQSTQSIHGYRIQTTDGAIGTVSGFMVDDRSWAIRELVVETGHWYSGKEILISPGKIQHINYEDSSVLVNLTKADIQQTAEHHLVSAGANQAAASFPTE